MYLLVPISVLLVFAIGLLFWWALNNHQFDSLDEAGERILKDTDSPTLKADQESDNSAK